MTDHADCSLELIDKYLTGELTEEEQQLLFESIEQRPENLDHLCDSLLVHCALHQRYETLRGVHLPVTSCSLDKIDFEIVARWSVRQWLWGASLLTLAGVCLIGCFFWLFPYRTSTFVPVAQIRETIDVVWEENAEIFKKQQKIGPNRLSLKKGLVQIDFFNGAELILEGPGEYIIRDDKSLFCDRGKISGYVGNKGSGFEIITPMGAVIDRGTEFSVDISSQGTNVEVVQGLVELVVAEEQPTLLTQGKGSLIRRTGGTFSYPAAGESFVSRREFLNRLVENVSYFRAERDKITQICDSNPALFLRYDFTQGDGLTVPNQSRIGQSRTGQGHTEQGHATDATLSRTRIGKGRLYGTKAIMFEKGYSTAIFDAPGQFKSLTLMAIVRVDRLGNQGNVLFASGAFQKIPGTFLWQLSRQGGMQMQLTPTTIADQNCFDSPLFFNRSQWGTWCHLALVIDGDSKMISLYADGLLLKAIPWINPIPLQIGSASIGNYQTSWATQSDRYFDGAFEEFLIFDRPLSAGEISQLSRY